MTTDEPDDTILEEISRADCLQLVATQVIGRVAVAGPGEPPLVVPVNFVLDGDEVLFRTDDGTKFRVAVHGGYPVSFEVDGVDPGRRTGWSVLVHGEASEADRSDLERLPVRPWAPGPKDHLVRIVPSAISGRRIRLVGDAEDGRGYL